MKHIKTFNENNIMLQGDPVRTAVRAVILKGRSLWMIHLRKTKEYKFPGGGIESGEMLMEALKREVMEETGREIDIVKSCIGYVDQIYPDLYEKDSVFSMRSVYYLATIKDEVHDLNLSHYERDLQFKPKWIDIDDAIIANEMRMLDDPDHWTERELYMLKYVRDNII